MSEGLRIANGTKSMACMRALLRLGAFVVVLCGCELLGGSKGAPEPTKVDAPQAPVSTEPPLRVLFVGNSHTYYNDMPKMIAQLARAAGKRALEFEMEATGAATLENHLRDGRVSKHLRKHWDHVVLQEQQQRPSFRFNMDQLEREFFSPARTFDILIKAAGAKTWLYMTAARLNGDPQNVAGDTYDKMQDRVRDSYVQLGEQLGANVLPVGEAYRLVHAKHPRLPLWAPDGSHPSIHGSYLAACMFFASLYATSPVGNAYAGNLPPTEAARLQEAASATADRGPR